MKVCFAFELNTGSAFHVFQCTHLLYVYLVVCWLSDTKALRK